MNYLYYAASVLEFLAAITATVYFYKYKHTILKWLLPLFWYIALNERIARLYWEYTEKSNNIFYNIFDFIYFTLLIWIIQRIVSSKKRKKKVKFLLVGYCISFLVNATLTNPLIDYLKYSYTAGSIILVVAVLFYLIDLLLSEQVSKIQKDLFLWICIGLLIFNISYPVIISAQFLYGEDSGKFESSLRILQGVIIHITYLIIAFGFIWSEKKSK